MAANWTNQIYEALKQELLDGLHAPRSKLQIDLIAARFEVSLGAVREALSRLTSDRLVVAEPQRGFTVAPVSTEDLVDLTAVRIEIETRCLRSSIYAAISNGRVGFWTRGISSRARRPKFGAPRRSIRTGRDCILVFTTISLLLATASGGCVCATNSISRPNVTAA